MNIRVTDNRRINGGINCVLSQRFSNVTKKPEHYNSQFCVDEEPSQYDSFSPTNISKLYTLCFQYWHSRLAERTQNLTLKGSNKKSQPPFNYTMLEKYFQYRIAFQAAHVVPYNFWFPLRKWHCETILFRTQKAIIPISSQKSIKLTKKVLKKISWLFGQKSKQNLERPFGENFESLNRIVIDPRFLLSIARCTVTKLIGKEKNKNR